MDSFNFLWQLLEAHGVVYKRKAEASRVWSGYTLDEQRAIYRSIRDKLRAGAFVNFYPDLAILENAPKRVVTEPQLLSPAEQARNLQAGVPMVVVKWKGRFPVITKADAMRFGLKPEREF